MTIILNNLLMLMKVKCWSFVSLLTNFHPPSSIIKPPPQHLLMYIETNNHSSQLTEGTLEKDFVHSHQQPIILPYQLVSILFPCTLFAAYFSLK